MAKFTRSMHLQNYNFHHCLSQIESPHDLLSFEGRVFFFFSISFLQFGLVKLLHFRQVWLITHLDEKTGKKKKTPKNLPGRTIIILRNKSQNSHFVSICILPADFQRPEQQQILEESCLLELYSALLSHFTRRQ